MFSFNSVFVVVVCASRKGHAVHSPIYVIVRMCVPAIPYGSMHYDEL